MAEMWIGNRWAGAADGRVFEVLNPACTSRLLQGHLQSIARSLVQTPSATSTGWRHVETRPSPWDPGCGSN